MNTRVLPWASRGGGRFELVAWIGAGGMGEVYEAIDHDGAGRVALKTLPHVEPRGLQRFKREFRVLRELRHPGLTAMHDLVRDEAGWFFTMERIDGLALRDHLRPGRSSDHRTLTGTSTGGETHFRRPGTIELAAPVDEERLADAVRQLCDALAHVHAHGLVHRDVKPSNVLVDERGQVVLLDFGIIGDESRRDGRAGTVAYMAPEQAAGLPVGTAADLYAVGLILLESLTGRIPLIGERRALLAARAVAEPPVAELVACGARSARTAHLAELAIALLARRPEDRPLARDVVRRLATNAPVAARARWRSPVFVGREAELATLDRALERARGGEANAVAVLGEAGIGKTALVREFAARMARAGCLVLTARSSERELVPFRAVDGMLDQLAEYLTPELAPVDTPRALSEAPAQSPERGSECSAGRALSEAPAQSPERGSECSAARALSEAPAQSPERGSECSAGRALSEAPADLVGTPPGRGFGWSVRRKQTLGLSLDSSRLEPGGQVALEPADAAALAAAFPVLAETLGQAGGGAAPSNQQRRRMFRGFRRLLALLAARVQVVLILDDAQWADEDGSALLAHALAAPAPPILFVLAARGESPPTIAGALGLACADVPIGALPPPAARLLASRLASDSAQGAAAAAAIAAAAGGHPLFIEELVIGDAEGERPCDIDQLLTRRVSELPADARRVLQLVAVGGQVPRSVLAAATDVALGPALVRLQSLRLIASGQRASALTVEPFHARVHDVVTEMLDAEMVREHHRSLARAYEVRGSADPEELAAHWAGAGELAIASGHAAAAARQAHAALAFDRAARWYRRSRELAVQAAAAPAAIARLDAAIGDVLVDAGRGREAAAALLRAADGGGGDAPELRRRAAEQLLLVGDVDAGLAVLRDELRAVGLRMPAGRMALPSLALRRLQIRVRGLRPRSEIRADPERLRRIDLSWIVAHGLLMYDAPAGAAFQSRHALLALDSGEPYRVTRALALEAAYLAAHRGHERRARRALAGARRAAEASGNPLATALVSVAACLAAFFRGRYREALASGHDAEQRLLTLRGGVWELGLARHHTLLAQLYLGELREARARLASLMEDARDRGDRYGEVYLQASVTPFLQLVVDDTAASSEDAVAAAGRALPRWRVQIYTTMMSVAQGKLYAGDSTAALAWTRRRWPALARSLLLEIGFLRVESFRLRARACLAAAEETTGGERRRLLRAARRDQRRVEHEGGIPAAPFGALLGAAAARLAGDEQLALTRLRAAEESFTAADMALMARVSRRSRGLLIGGDEGAALVAAADEWMRGQTIASPDRFAHLLAPGLGHIG